MIKPFLSRIVDIPVGSLMLLLSFNTFADTEIESWHAGFLHPAGVDLAGYSREKQINNNLYRFYTFGFPSLAAVGINYFEHYGASGFNSTIGVGIGSVAYASFGYQWKLDIRSNLKLGAGYTTNVAYTGWFPVLSYEKHFDPR